MTFHGLEQDCTMTWNSSHCETECYVVMMLLTCCYHVVMMAVFEAWKFNASERFPISEFHIHVYYHRIATKIPK